MPNKTIYVSEKDESLFEQAKEIAGATLSSVLVRALREYVSRHIELVEGMKEISIKVGSHSAGREQRFIAAKLGDWRGFSDDKEWWMNAVIYRTQKGNFAVYLTTVCKASLITNKKEWKENAEYLTNPSSSELFVGNKITDFGKKLPAELRKTLQELTERYETPIEYLDI